MAAGSNPVPAGQRAAVGVPHHLEAALAGARLAGADRGHDGLDAVLERLPRREQGGSPEWWTLVDTNAHMREAFPPGRPVALAFIA
jgi:hypothetical protein